MVSVNVFQGVLQLILVEFELNHFGPGGFLEGLRLFVEGQKLKLGTKFNHIGEKVLGCDLVGRVGTQSRRTPDEHGVSL